MSFDAFDLNFNNAAVPENGFDAIPAGTLLKVVMTIKPGAYGPEGLFTQGKTGSVYLNAELTALKTGQKYGGRKIFHLIGFKSSDEKIAENGGVDKWGPQGKSFIRSVLESARNINPKDESPNAAAARNIRSYGDLNGIEFAVRLGIDPQPDQNGNKRNTVQAVLTPADKDYAAVMSGTWQPVGPGQNNGFGATAPAGGQAWGAPNTAPAAAPAWGAQSAANGASPGWAAGTRH